MCKGELSREQKGIPVRVSSLPLLPQFCHRHLCFSLARCKRSLHSSQRACQQCQPDYSTCPRCSSGFPFPLGSRSSHCLRKQHLPASRGTYCISGCLLHLRVLTCIWSSPPATCLLPQAPALRLPTLLLSGFR